MSEITTEQVKNPEEKKVPNPTGKGGFIDNPENINKGGRKKNPERFGYWLQEFKNMTVKELENYLRTEKNPDGLKSKEDMTVAEYIAFNRVVNAKDKLEEYKDLADRTEGKAPQTIRHDGVIQTGVQELAQTLQNIYDDTTSSSNEPTTDSSASTL